MALENCLVCERRLVFEFTDLHGEGCCTSCGTPYMLAGFSGRSETECTVTPEGLEVLRAYWRATGAFSAVGCYMGTTNGGGRDVAGPRHAFNAWCDAHPELMPAEAGRG